MPTYEYVCRDCGEHVEVFQSFREDPLTVCGLCGGRLRKVFGAAGIIFKGSGYYVTDSRKKPAPAGADSSDGASGSGASGSGASGSGPAASGKSSGKPAGKAAESA